jgi:hypothetical protein
VHRAPLAVLSALLALALGGCGDGTLSAGQLRTQASAVCTRGAATASRVAMPAGADGGERFLRAGLARLRPALARLERLRPPSELRDSYRQAVRLRREGVALVARDERAIERGQDPVATFRALQARLAPLEGLEGATWGALQIPACAPR